MKFQLLAFSAVAIAASIFSSGESEAASACSNTKRNEVLNNSGTEVIVNCNLTLSSSDVVNKTIIVEGSAADGVTINCNNALVTRVTSTFVGFVGGEPTYTNEHPNVDVIEIRSKQVGQSWDRPQNVTVKNCRVEGGVRVWGMGKNHEAEPLRIPSQQSNFEQVTRNNAPKNITLDNLDIVTFNRTNVYIAPGSTYVTLSNSELRGNAASVALYLDAQSGFNNISNNNIHTQNHRELIAIDGSENNTITNNWFSALNNGGIYLYRNCGEAGIVRHTTPANNLIINNEFWYKNYTGNNPAVFFGSRNGNRPYCNSDSGYPFGSSASNFDFATNNTFANNIIYNRNPSDLIKTGRSTDNPNSIYGNTRVNQANPSP